MASSSGQSSRASSSTRTGGGGYDGQGSPVPYRVPPLGYEPPVFCRCKLKACRWILWSSNQPGRRYYRCKHAMTNRDCGYYKWIDEESSEWMKELLRDLRDTVWRLKRELNQEVGDEGCDSEVVDEVAKMNQFLQKEVMKKDAQLEAKEKELQERVEELEGKDKKLEAMTALLKKHNGCPAVLVYLFVFVLGSFVALVCKWFM